MPLSPQKLSPLVHVFSAGSPSPTLRQGEIALAQVPSTAFGDGSHPTTGLCATAVDFLCRRNPASAFLDVGTGTGILARIARARGASYVVATDIDQAALEVAASNAELDEATVPIHLSRAAPDAWGPRFDIVVANILEPVLVELSTALSAALAPEGRLLISGFTPPQLPSLRVAFGALGQPEVSYQGEWALALFQR